MLSANKVLLKSVCLWKRMQISPNIQANKLFEKWYTCHGSGWQNKEMNKQYHWFIPLLLVHNKEKHKSLRLPTLYTEISQLSTQKLTFYDFFILRSIAISCLWILWMVALRYLRASIADDRISINWKISFWHGYHQHTKWYRQAGNTGKTGPSTMKPEQSNMSFADNVLDTNFGRLVIYLTKILPMVFPRSSIDDRLSLVQVMAGWRTNDGLIQQRMDVHDFYLLLLVKRRNALNSLRPIDAYMLVK